MDEGMMPFPLITLLLLVFTALASALFTFALLRIFPTFRSQEQKQGEYRSDAVARPASSSRLPTVGGPAMLIAMALATIVSSRITPGGMTQAAPVLVLCWLQGTLGWIDDWSKSGGQGLSERIRLVWMVVVTVCWSLWYAVAFLPPGTPPLARFGWWAVACVFLLWIALSTAFSDGIDGLTAGISAVSTVPLLIFGLIAVDAGLAVAASILLGAAVGFWCMNQPSRWSRRGAIPRRAQAYLGDSGALVLGAGLGSLVVLNRWEVLWMIGGIAIVYEGTSVLVQTGILVPLFRRSLRLHRFRTTGTFVPHTEFPLPFLATPFHHHLSLIGLGPLDTVLWLYSLAGSGALLSIAAATVISVPIRLSVALIAVLLYGALLAWTLLSRGSFLSWDDQDAGKTRIQIRRGLPLRLLGKELSWSVGETVGPIPPSICPVIQPLLYRRIGRNDAPAALAQCLWLAGDTEAALQRWRAMPPLALLLRPEYAVYVAQHAYQNGALDALLHTWREALKPMYQSGRTEIALRQIISRAEGEEQQAFRAALVAVAGPPTLYTAI